MVEVRLHGALASEYGRCWHLDIATPLEAVRAIECARNGFKRAIMALSEAGMVFRVRSKRHDYDSADVGCLLGEIDRIDIIPIVAGASAGVRFVIGAVLTAIGVAGTLFSAGTSNFLTTAGISLMLGAVTEWLTPTPKREDVSNLQSWSVSGPTNTVEQGLPVPVAYGEVLIGGYTISAGIAAAQMSPSGSIGPAVSIGGNLNPVVYTNGAAVITVAVLISATSFNLDEPFTYSWVFAGFPQASARRLVNAGTATLRLELDYIVIQNQFINDPGTVTAQINGRLGDGTASSASKEEAVLVRIDGTSYTYTDGGA